jgi:hypothetical protein
LSVFEHAQRPIAERFRQPTGCSRREFGGAKKNFGARRATQFAMAYEITMKRRTACREARRERHFFALTALLADVQSPLSRQQPLGCDSGESSRGNERAIRARSD